MPPPPQIDYIGMPICPVRTKIILERTAEFLKQEIKNTGRHEKPMGLSGKGDDSKVIH